MNKSNREADGRWKDFYELAAMMAFLIVVVWLGVVGFGLMVIFFCMAAFVQAQFTTAMMISAPGGLLLMAYHILIARRLFQLAR